MQSRKQSVTGFTIVELLIVIVVIGILAGITIVAFNGVRQYAGEAVLQADLRSATTEIEQEWLTEGSYPANVSDVERSAGTVYEYTGETNYFCITASSENAQKSFYYGSDDPVIREGVCPGHDGFVDNRQLLFSIGNYHGCALGDTLYCWGSNFSGALGDGTASTQSLTPQPVDLSTGLAGKKITALASAEDSTCVIADNIPYCWGEYGYTYYGTGTPSSGDARSPVQVSNSGVLAGKTLVAIAAGQATYCVLDSEGAVYCWGRGPLGDGSTTTSRNPVEVDLTNLGSDVVTKIEAGNNTVCMVASARAYCWGTSRTGDGTSIQRNIPVAVDTTTGLGSKQVTDISSSTYSSTCAVADGEGWCWGNDYDGVHGNDSDMGNTTFLSPRPVNMTTSALAGRTITQVAAGYIHTCVVADGAGYCFGWNGAGALGNNSTTQSYLAVAVNTSGVLAGKTITKIDAGEQFSCANSGMELFCWGSGNSIGIGPSGNISTPAAVIGFGG